jgi:O-antigen/teichoic acid export membrane protein
LGGTIGGDREIALAGSLTNQTATGILVLCQPSTRWLFAMRLGNKEVTVGQRSWVGDSPYNMLDRNLKTMGLTMLVGAILDLIVALGTLLFAPQIAAWVGLEQADETFYLLTLVHLVFPPFCILAWMDTKRNVAIVTGAIVARTIYALFTFALVLLLGAAWIWAIAGGASLLLAVVHYVFLRRSDFGFWEVFSQAGNPPAMKK